MIVSVAPNIVKIGLRKIVEKRMIIAPIRRLLYRACLLYTSIKTSDPIDQNER